MHNTFPNSLEFTLINGELIESSRIPKFLLDKTKTYIAKPEYSLLSWLKYKKRIAEDTMAPQGEIELLSTIIDKINKDYSSLT